MQLHEFIFCILCLLEKCSILLGLFMRYANFFLDLIFDGCCQKKIIDGICHCFYLWGWIIYVFFSNFDFTFTVYCITHSWGGPNFFFLIFGFQGLGLGSLSDVDDLTTTFAKVRLFPFCWCKCWLKNMFTVCMTNFQCKLVYMLHFKPNSPTSTAESHNLVTEKRREKKVVAEEPPTLGNVKFYEYFPFLCCFLKND